jgi:hypothetical protein
MSTTYKLATLLALLGGRSDPPRDVGAGRRSGAGMSVRARPGERGVVGTDRLDDALRAGLDDQCSPDEVAVLAGATTADGRELALVTRPESSPRERLVLIGCDGSFLGQLTDGFDEIRAVTTSAGHVAAGGATVSVWELSSLRQVARLELGRLIRALAFDAFGDVLADGSAVVWRPSSSTPAVQWTAHDGEASAVAVHPRLPVLATGGEDGAIRLWWFDGSPAGEVEIGGWVVALAFATSGAALLASTWERPPHLCTLEVELADGRSRAADE